MHNSVSSSSLNVTNASVLFLVYMITFFIPSFLERKYLQTFKEKLSNDFNFKGILRGCTHMDVIVLICCGFLSGSEVFVGRFCMILFNLYYLNYKEVIFYVLIKESLTGSLRIIMWPLTSKQASKHGCHFYCCCDAVARNSLHLFDMWFAWIIKKS